jgi:tellurite resistance protein
MFKLTDETRTAIVAILKDKFSLTQSDDEINSVIDEIVDMVKRQFGM